ncbi:hypothetical protein KBY28_12220 [Ruegeria pomeroyi]|uniref:hypothetical protein n=1 Tax=Ruegeria pomeroyi TaxID=89184 RepID=UPI001F227C0C|nr:hypothetical protein [Ruegeria pomeroyi]MCE8509212.1 hypothetical protein [Ruegeria pomeroyi]
MTRLQPKPVIGFLLNPIGQHAKGIEYRDSQLCVSARPSRKIHLNDIDSAPLVTHKLLGSEITIRCDDGHGTTLKGANRRCATEFAKTIEADWIAHNTERFEGSRSSIDAVLMAIAELEAPTRYPSACLVHPVAEQARHLDESLIAKLPMAAIGEDAHRQARTIQHFARNAGQIRSRAISTFEQQQLANSGIVTDKRQSLYSLRHWFQDQLTKRDVVDRAQAQLMGHKFQRPKYGYGKDLVELREIVAQFAISA